jgi:hypothetical protein
LQPTPLEKLDLALILFFCISSIQAWDLEIKTMDQETQD